MKRSDHQSSILATKTARFLWIAFLMFLINMHLKKHKFLGVTTNHKPQTTLRLAIVKSFRLKSKAGKTELSNNKQNYKKQGNSVTKQAI